MPQSINYFIRPILSLPRYVKQILAILCDISLCIIATWLAFYLRLDQFIIIQGNISWAAIISIVIAIPVFWLTGIYKTMFRYSGKSVIVTITFAIIIYGLLYFSVISVYSLAGIPRSIGILQTLVLFFLISGSRLVVRYLLGGNQQSKLDNSNLPRALVYGAGNAGIQLVSALNSSYEMKVVGFIDDDTTLQGQVLNGHTIYSFNDLSSIILTKKVTHILLALPSISRNRRNKILKKINHYKVIVHTLPSISDLTNGRVTTSDIRELMIEDILEREQVLPNIKLLTKNIESKIILVTGAGGSIGSELCKQILILSPIKLLLVENNEYALYKIHQELKEIKEKMDTKLKHVKIIPLLSSAQSEQRMKYIFKAYKPNTIYHAAAYKHVPLVEENICEGVKNNVFGTLNIAKIAIEEKVSDFVLISSDKAVYPTNVMGASKRLAELCLQGLYKSSKNIGTRLCMVRFGNVLGSSGSLIPRLKKQIKNGGPVTLTHLEVTRYFMTIPEAAQLVIQAGAMSKGSDVFLLEMGNPIKILDLIKRIVILSGLSILDKDNPEGDIKIKIIGLRPGEKLYEELLLGDNAQATDHPKIQRAEEKFITWSLLEPDLQDLEVLLDQNKVYDVLKLLQKLVKGYKFNGKIYDHTFSSNNKNE
jgi:FlaA1/EpsC-like NDP-sugar epimerase